MNLKRVLSKDVVRLDLQGVSKTEIITELVDILVDAGKIPDRATALQSVLDRERKMSTGLENGIAIPHGKTDAVDDLVVCIGLKIDGVDFDAMDGKPCRIFIMTISPAKRSGPHMQFLAEISGLLRTPEKRKAILECETEDELVSLFVG